MPGKELFVVETFRAGQLTSSAKCFTYKEASRYVKFLLDNNHSGEIKIRKEIA